MKKFVTLMALLMAALLLVGCSIAPGVDVKKDGKVTVKSEDGKSTMELGGEENSLPDGFPKEVPVIDGKITSSMKTTKEGSEGFMVLIDTDKSFKDALSWYKAELKSAGMSEDSSFEQSDSAILGGKLKENSINVTITKDNEKTIVSLWVTPNK